MLNRSKPSTALTMCLSAVGVQAVVLPSCERSVKTMRFCRLALPQCICGRCREAVSALISLQLLTGAPSSKVAPFRLAAFHRGCSSHSTRPGDHSFARNLEHVLSDQAACSAPKHISDESDTDVRYHKGPAASTLFLSPRICFKLASLMAARRMWAVTRSFQSSPVQVQVFPAGHDGAKWA